MPETAILSTTYAGPVSYYTKFLLYNNIFIEALENFYKQTYRSRCIILSANGPLTLSIPVVHTNQNKINIREVIIDYTTRWQAVHWRAIESAYRSAPFFLYYADDLKPFYFTNQYKNLFNYNDSLQQVVCNLIGIVPSIAVTNIYQEKHEQTHDYRNVIHPKINFNDKHFVATPYYQVFSNKFGFVPNLGILDLLFNMGNEAIDILKKSIKK